MPSSSRETVALLTASLSALVNAGVLIKGPPGDKGEPGYTPRKGIDYLREPKDGKPGRDGKDGKSGLDGRDGRDGKDGTSASISVESVRELVDLVLSSEPERFRGPAGTDGSAGEPGVRIRGEWKQGEKYSHGDLVALGGDWWYADNSGPESRPGRGMKWKLFVQSRAGRLSGFGVVQGQGGGGSGPGVSDHALLSNLAWTSSGHTGGANLVPFFDATGVAATASAFSYTAATDTIAAGKAVLTTHLKVGPYSGSSTANISSNSLYTDLTLSGPDGSKYVYFAVNQNDGVGLFGASNQFYMGVDDPLEDILFYWGEGEAYPTIVGKLDINTTAVGNVGAGEDNLIAYAMPADALNKAGRGVRITQWGTFANTAETKTLKSYFGGQVVLTTALAANLAGVWKIVVEVFSTGTDTQEYLATLITTGVDGVAINDLETGSATQDDGATITIKCTGDVGAPSTNDGIIQRGSLVEMIS